MKRNTLSIYFFFFILVFGGAFFIFYKFSLAANDASINATVKISVCGNGVKEGGEQCDGSDLNSQSCATKGFSGGTLSCKADCTFDTSACTSAPPPSGGGGGGGGGNFFPPPNVGTAIVFSGYAYPNSQVTLLKDAEVVATTVAGDDAYFKIDVPGLSPGNYVFSFYSTDKYGDRSVLRTFSISITGGATAEVSGIFLSPTLSVDNSTVKQGDPITFFGQTVPNASITININSSGDFFSTTTANSDGEYLKEFNTAFLDFGNHTAFSLASTGNLITDNSKVVGFAVGTENIKNNPRGIKGDLNGDGRVNIVDFSIEAYWYGKPNPPAIVLLDGKSAVDLADFSIMAYYWTG